MKNLFFYGTLRHVPLLESVLGRAASDLDVTAAVLPAYAVLAAQEGPFPVLVADAHAQADGVLVRGLSPQDIARLDYYEAGFDFDLRHLALADGQMADVYVPTPDLWSTNGPWDFAAWVRDWSEMSVFASQEVMDGFGHIPPEEIARRFPRIRARAWSRVLAQ